MIDRPRSPSLDALLGREFPVLDHGFIRVVDYMGNDDAIVQAARVSYGTGTKSVTDDRNLIRYLLRHRHTTPFEMAEIKLHVKLPIFVARQWIRHRTASVNEYSARYSLLDREFYVPSDEVIAVQSTENKQGRSDSVPADQAIDVARKMAEAAGAAYSTYLGLLNEETGDFKSDPRRDGIARELARAVLPVSFYTQWYWKIDLHNLMHFLALRLDPHAQYEIRCYAQEILKIVQAWVPHTCEAFVDYRIDAIEMSAPALRVVKRLLSGEVVNEANSGLSRREWRELLSSLGRTA
jgi:thymidylate synthase (FAD)